MPDSVKCLLEVYEAVEQIALVLQVLLCDDPTIEDLFYCAPAGSKTYLVFCQRLGLESVDDNSEHVEWLIRLMVR